MFRLQKGTVPKVFIINILASDYFCRALWEKLRFLKLYFFVLKIKSSIPLFNDKFDTMIYIATVDRIYLNGPHKQLCLQFSYAWK